jgi:3-oxoacyl-[acyl-carrier-protein] synthase-3
MALDISLGCSGWVHGLAVLSGLMRGGTIRKALLLAGDARKQVYEEPDQLFGYAGTATALEFTGNDADRFMFHFGTDGSGYDAIIRPAGGCRNQATPKDFELVECEDGRKRHNFQTRMKGMDVFGFGISTAPKSIKKLGEHFGFDYMAADYCVLHQANMKMNEAIVKKLKIGEEKAPSSMSHFGNTSSASIPLTIVTQLKNKIENKKTKFICCGFGVGLSWGTVAFETDSVVISDLVEVKEEA